MVADVIPFVARLPAAVTTAHGVILERRGFYLRNGSALGEATPLPEFGTEDLAACEAALIDALGGARGEARDTDAFAPCARHALEQLAVTLQGDPALVLAARARVVLGTAALRTSVLAVHDVDALVALASATLATATLASAVVATALAPTLRGWAPVVKLKTTDPDETVRLLRALRVRVPAERLRVRLDCNGGLDEAAARAFLGALRDDDGVELVEQPVSAADLDGLCALARDMRVTIAADEALVDPSSRDALLRADVPLAFIWKPQAVGGASVVIDAVARRPERVHVVTGFLDTAIGHGFAHATARVVDAITGVQRCHGLGTIAQVVS